MTFLIFPGFSPFVRELFGDFPDCPFPLSRPINSAYEEQSRKGPRHNLDLSRKKSRKPPGLETPQFSFSQNMADPLESPEDKAPENLANAILGPQKWTFGGPLFSCLVDVSVFFNFFSARGRGVRGAGGGGDGFIENPRGGGGVSRRGKGRGAGRVSAANWGIFLGGEGYFFFFFRAERSTKLEIHMTSKSFSKL